MTDATMAQTNISSSHKDVAVPNVLGHLHKAALVYQGHSHPALYSLSHGSSLSFFLFHTSRVLLHKRHPLVMRSRSYHITALQARFLTFMCTTFALSAPLQ